TSGSMDTEVESQQTFDAAEAYEGGCTAGRVYWRQGTGDPPGCGTDRWFETSALRCAAAAEAFGGSGFMTDRVGRYDATTDRWRVLDGASDALVECRSDAGTHGDAGGSSAVYAQDGVTGAPWSDTATDQIDWTTLDEVTLFSGNYLNWYHGPTNSSTRMEVLQNVARGLAGSINGVNVGLMRFNGDDGGRLVHAVEDVAADRAALLDSIDSLNPSGMTPLSETMYEAALYFLGRPPHYGDGTGVSDGRYVSPIQHACQKSFIVYLSDGEPSRDTDAAELAPALPGFNGLVGASCDGSGDGACL